MLGGLLLITLSLFKALYARISLYFRYLIIYFFAAVLLTGISTLALLLVVIIFLELGAIIHLLSIARSTV